MVVKMMILRIEMTMLLTKMLMMMWGRPARETKLRLPIKAIAGFLKSYNCENHDDDDFCPQDDDNAKMEEAKTNCFYATLKRMSQFLWRPSHQVALKRKEVFHLGDPKSPI